MFVSGYTKAAFPDVDKTTSKAFKKVERQTYFSEIIHYSIVPDSQELARLSWFAIFISPENEG